MTFVKTKDRSCMPHSNLHENLRIVQAVDMLLIARPPSRRISRQPEKDMRLSCRKMSG